MPRLSRWAVPVLVLAAPLAVLLWLRAGTGESVDATETRAEALMVSPTARTVLDERRVSGVPVWRAGLALRAPGWSGTITALDIKEGSVIESGTRVVTVAGVPRLAIASAQPFHRQLQHFATGPDVAELHRLLLQMGYLLEGPEQPSVYLFNSSQAVRRLETALGITPTTGNFDPAWFVWLPVAPFEVGKLELGVGAQAPGAGMEFALEPPRLASATLASANQNEPLVLDPSIRWVLQVGQGRFPVDAATLQVAEASLPELSKLLEPDAERLDGLLRRETALNVLAVPSTAVTVGDAGRLCVWLAEGDGYRAQAVKVAGARSGATNVSEGLAANARILANPAEVLESTRCP